MEDNQTIGKEKLEYYMKHLDRCWIASQHYKEDLNKLLIWLGSLFVGIIAVTGLFGASKQTGVSFSFTFFHVILFHWIFAISWFFYLHKKLRAEMFIHMGIHTEKYIREHIMNYEMARINTFFDIKSYYSEPGHRLKFTTSKGAMLLILLLYICMITYPIFFLKLSKTSIAVGNHMLFCLIIFGLIILFGHILYKHEEKHVMKFIRNEWTNIDAPIV